LLVSMYMLHVCVRTACPCPCCMSMFMLIISMSMQHVLVHAVCPCASCVSMSMLRVQVYADNIHVHAPWFMAMSMLHVHIYAHVCESTPQFHTRIVFCILMNIFTLRDISTYTHTGPKVVLTAFESLRSENLKKTK
jgi:hypothetical protein